MQRREWKAPVLLVKVDDKILTHFGASRCYELLEVSETGPGWIKAHKPDSSYLQTIDPEEVRYVLAPNETLAATMWAGGWDDYVVDTAHIRPLTDEEKDAIQHAQESGGGLHPSHKGWILGIFVPRICGEDQCVKQIAHLGGGD